MKQCKLPNKAFQNVLDSKCEVFYKEINPILFQMREKKCEIDQKKLINKIHICSPRKL
jgi:hypothetical protein